MKLLTRSPIVELLLRHYTSYFRLPFTVKISSLAPVAHFTKMREGTQDKRPEYEVGESQREGTFWV